MEEMIDTKKELNNCKQPATLDEALDARINPIIDAVNTHVEKIYHDFNMALYKQVQNSEKTENELSRMVQILWGIVNKATVRMAAIEIMLVRGGMDKESFENEIIRLETELKEAEGWQELPLDDFGKEKAGEASPSKPPESH